MGKAKNGDKKKNGCVMWLAAFSLLVLLFLGGYSVFGGNRGDADGIDAAPTLSFDQLTIQALPTDEFADFPLYESVDIDAANYVVTQAYFIRPCSSMTDFERCPGVMTAVDGSLLQVIDYEYGEELKGSEIWYIIEIDGESYVFPSVYAEPISPELAIELPE